MAADLRYWGRRLSRRGALAVGGAAFVAACGGDSKKEDSNAPAGGTSASPGAGGAPAQAQVKTGGTLRYHIPKDPGNLDVHLATDSSTTAFSNLVYNSMLRFKTGPNVDTGSLEIEGDLAEKWETPDTQTVVLTIRQGVKWQNKGSVAGRAFTAEDARAGILRIGTNKPEFQRATFFQGIDKIDVTSPTTIVIKQKEPNVPFLTYLAVPYHKILPKELTDADQAKTQMIGTGPFLLDSYQSGGKAVFKKNPDYWKKDAAGQALPYLDSVEIAGPLEPAVRFDAFRAGQTDLITFDKSAEADTAKKQISGATIDKFTPFFFYMPFGFDVTRGPFQDERVRQAIAVAIDHPAIRKAIFQDEAVRATPIPVGFKDWVADMKELEYYGDKPDLTKAKQLMDAAGMTAGFKTKMDTNVSYTDEAETMPLLQDMLRKIGVDATELLKVERAAFLGPTNVPGGFEMRLWHHSAFSEPDEFITNFYQTGASRNYGGWGNTQLDALIKQQRNIADKAERKKVLVEIQKILARTNWRVALDQKYEYVGWYNKVKGWKALAADPGYYALAFENTWLDR
jgi:peptide/nickel transport system substrate-binding protein